MRKFFEGHSLVGVVIILTSFVLAIFLRFYDLSSQSPWTDEVASWWYIRHMDRVFFEESHTPLFYGILKICLNEPSVVDIRHFVAGISVLHLIEFFFLGQLSLNKKAFLLFWVLICLNPVDIVYARMARHYSWFLEGTLIYFLLWRIGAPRWIKAFVGTFMTFIHVFAAIPVAVLAAYDFFMTRRSRDLLISLIPCILILGYYICRIVILGNEKVISNISWVHSSLYVLLASSITQFFGESYPRFEYYPVSPLFSGIAFAASIALIAYFRKSSGNIFFLLFIVTVLLIELLMPWTNFRVGRYLIFLSGIWLFSIAESLEEVKGYIYYPVLISPLVYLLYFNPFLSYPWEKEKVQAWKDFRSSHKVSQIVICANQYQREYYKFFGDECAREIRKVDTSRPFLLFDIGVNHFFALATVIDKMEVSESLRFDRGGGLIAMFVPKKNNAKAEIKVRK